MQDSGDGDEKELSAAVRERMRESGALDRISADVRSGAISDLKFPKSEYFQMKINQIRRK